MECTNKRPQQGAGLLLLFHWICFVFVVVVLFLGGCVFICFFPWFIYYLFVVVGGEGRIDGGGGDNFQKLSTHC